MKKKYLAAAFAAMYCLGMQVPGAQAAVPAGQGAEVPQAAESGQSAKTYSLDFDASTYEKRTKQVNGKDVAYRAYENRVYVSHPVDAAYESMNLYIPEAYFEGKSVNGYTAETAPIFLPNTVGGYMPGPAGTEDSPMSGKTILAALQNGYVVAAPGARGRTNQAADGTYTGKAPALIVDMKAAVRYLRYNAKNLPAGDTEKIISNGTSAGGALSALLGATGNSADYEPYLREIGAAETRDDIFATSAYCPITNLEHADMAYEWVFGDVHTYHQGKMGMMPAGQKPQGMPPQNGAAPADMGMPPTTPGAAPDGAVSGRPANAPAESTSSTALTAKQIKVSKELRKAFPAYVDSLHLKAADGTPVTLDAKGNGTFKEYIKGLYLASAQTQLDAGKDLSDQKWLTVKNGKAVDMDLGKYAEAVTRLKGVPAFDSLDLSSGENSEFGSATINARHFTEIGRKYNTAAHAQMTDPELVKLLNPLDYIGKDGVKTAKYFRIRHGETDRDTALPIPAILALALENHGTQVDFAVPWGQGHAGDYDLAELFAWIDHIAR